MEAHLFVPRIDDEAREQHRRWLLELTALPTASGREHQVIAWIQRWFDARKNRLTLETDQSGNVVGKLLHEPVMGQVTFVDAHLDHPAFVVVSSTADGKVEGAAASTAEPLEDESTVVAEFRGSVADSYFIPGTQLQLHLASGQQTTAVLGERLPNHTGPFPRFVVQVPDTSHFAGSEGTEGPDHLDVRFVRGQAVSVAAGEILRWDLGQPHVDSRNQLHTYATDNLACVVAALAMLDQLSQRAAHSLPVERIRVLFSRAEEIGFVGAYAAIKNGTIPTGARVLVLENSKAIRSIQLGNGVVVRLGDRISTVFSPQITAALTARVAQLTGRDSAGQQVQEKLLAADRLWQADLMPGGACHATLFQQFGYVVGCLVLPLLGYHNMGPDNRPCFEQISLADFDAMVDLLVSLGMQFPAQPDLTGRLAELFAKGAHVLE